MTKENRNRRTLLNDEGMAYFKFEQYIRGELDNKFKRDLLYNKIKTMKNGKGKLKEFYQFCKIYGKPTEIYK